MDKATKGTATWPLTLVALAPAAFLFAMMQMSAITSPFADHWETARFIITYYDRGIWTAITQILGDLQMHARPVTVRLLFLFNAVATGWDVRSEYVYLCGAFLATLAIHYRLILTLNGGEFDFRAALIFSVVSVLLFTPGSHNNHWWSWMLQLVLNNLLSLSALAVIALSPRDWLSNTLAAVLCWLSVYTLTNGLFLLLVVAGLSQLSSPRPPRPSLLTLFWFANAIAIAWLYFPISDPGASARPGLLNVLQFTLLYIGNPLGSLIWFQYPDMWQPHDGYALSLVCGVAVVGVLAWTLFAYRHYFRAPPPHFLILLGFTGYAILSAIGTGWGRAAADGFGVLNGNSSRYVITGVYAVFGLLYFVMVEARSVNRWSPTTAIVYAVFLVLATTAYIRSVPIYLQARDNGRAMRTAFREDGSNTPVDEMLYPVVDKVRSLRSDLRRLHLGPYYGFVPSR
jgi:hypothetical protein